MPGKMIRLRTGVTRGIKSGKAGVDREKHIIHGFSVITLGEAKGHDVMIDDTTLNQVIKFGNAHKLGMKSRFGHPNVSKEGFGTFLGRTKSFTKDGDRVRADLHIDPVAFNAPKGNLGDYIETLGENDPDAFGSSIVLKLKREFQLEDDGTRKKDSEGNELLPLARVEELTGVDLVDEPAVGDGMFSFFSDSVKPSAEITEFLDDFLSQDGAVDKAYSFINRYLDNEEYKIQADKITQRLEEIVELKKESQKNGIKSHNYKFTEKEEEKVMTDAEKKALEEKEEKKALEKKQREASAAERKELTAIQTVELLDTCSAFKIDAQFAKDLVAKNVTFAEAKDAILEKAKNKLTAINPKDDPNGAKVLADEYDKKIASFSNAVMVHCGLERDSKVVAEVGQNGLRGLGAQKLAAKCLFDAGVQDAFMLTPAELFETTIPVFAGASSQFADGATQGSGDFVNVLSNVLNKSVMMGWNTAPSTYERWVGMGELKDFKQADLVRLSEIGDVEQIREGEAPEMTHMTDLKEQTRLETWGSKYILTRQAMVDDDLAQLNTVPAKKTRALRRSMNRRAYGLLYDGNGANSAFYGPNMLEGTTKLFNSTAESTAGGHNNLVAAASGAVPGQATLDTGFFALSQHRAQSPDSGRSNNIYMDIKPRFILIGHNVEVEVFKLMKNIGYNVSGEDSAALGTNAANISGPGGPRNLEIVADAELDNIDDTYYPWWLAADPLDTNTITLYTLTGNTTPFTDSAPNPVGKARGIIWVIEHDYVFAAPDWRGLYCNSGPTK